HDSTAPSSLSQTLLIQILDSLLFLVLTILIVIAFGTVSCQKINPLLLFAPFVSITTSLAFTFTPCFHSLLVDSKIKRNISPCLTLISSVNCKIFPLYSIGLPLDERKKVSKLGIRFLI